MEHLHRLVGSWQLIADLAFADLLLWCPLSSDEGFICAGQMRPFTAQTLHPEDQFGSIVRAEELPVIDRAYHEGRGWRRDEPVLIDGVPVRMEAFPIRYGGRVIAVMTKEGAPLVHRRPGRLEQNYLECASALGRMVEDGSFPFKPEGMDPELSPRVGDGFLRLDRSGSILYASPNATSAFRRLGIVTNIEEQPYESLAADLEPAVEALRHGVPVEGDVEIGGSVVLQRVVPLLRGPSRSIVGGIVLIRDVTELRHRERLLRRKDAVIREIHHRVKNNLQTIASLLRVQSRRIDSVEAKAELSEAVTRIASIAVVHETLSRDSSELVEFGEIAEKVVTLARDNFILPARDIEVVLQGDAGRLPADIATPLALVLIELLQNSVEHGFAKESSSGRIEVLLTRLSGRVALAVSDDGEGFPPGFDLSDAGLGLQIVKELVESELGGTLEVQADGAERGSSVKVEVPARRRAGLNL